MYIYARGWHKFFLNLKGKVRFTRQSGCETNLHTSDPNCKVDSHQSFVTKHSFVSDQILLESCDTISNLQMY